MLTSRIRRTRLAGFTLVELLIVMSIIGILSAISAGAFFRVRAVQQKSSTEATLTKLNTALDNRWKAIQESVNEDQKKNQGQWPNALTTAGGNPDVARALLMYAKVKNELPMTFAEAKTDTVIGSITLKARANFLPVYPLSSSGIPEESAVCLYLAITTSGGGGAMLDGEGLQQQSIDYSAPGWGTTTRRVFTDAWGTPIAFVRQAYTAELNSPPYVRSGQSKDPFDPANKLSGATLTNTTLAQIWTQISSNVPSYADYPASYTATSNFVPTLVSAGPDKNFLSSGDLFGGSENDNILSYRLRRQGNKGD